jgi:antitoxin Phd
MPTILPISDLRNYNEVLKKVSAGSPVYLTRNGRGTYIINKLDDFDPETIKEDLLRALERGVESMKHGKSATLEEVAKKYNV